MFKYPYGNLHGLNLDWLIDQWKKFQTSFTSSFTARITQIGVNDAPSVDVTYDQNTGFYDFDFNLPEEVKPTGYEIGYQEGTSGTTIPSGSWLANPPAVSQGNYLWSRTRVIYNNGTYSATYAVSRMGVDGAGSPATVTPLMDGVANVGTSLMFAREDHVHPSDTSKLDASDFVLSTAYPVMDGTASAGSSTNVSRADHVHPSDTSKLDASDFVLSTASPVMDGVASAGSSTNVSRADHVHPSDTSRASVSDVAPLLYSNFGAGVSVTETNQTLANDGVLIIVINPNITNGYVQVFVNDEEVFMMPSTSIYEYQSLFLKKGMRVRKVDSPAGVSTITFRPLTS